MTLCLLMFVSIGVMLPIASSTAHGIRQSIEAPTARRHYRRHSRAWWRRYRARLRRRREAREAALSNLAAHRKAPLPEVTTVDGVVTTTTNVPSGWVVANADERKFRSTTSVPLPGGASLSVVAMSRPLPTYLSAREQKRFFSGVALSDLRRIVIDKMLAAGGWVINDYERDVTGHRVFVVTAQTPADGRSPEKSWNFYFTEVSGRIYSLTTNTPLASADRMAIEAERFMASLYNQDINR
jgi:hypothetical protein